MWQFGIKNQTVTVDLYCSVSCLDIWLKFLFYIFPTWFFFILFASRSKGATNFIQFLFLFYPILHITAITANIADHWNFTEQGHPCGIDVVPTGVSCRMIRHTHDIFRMTFGAATWIFHRQSLLVTTSKTQHSVSKAAAQIQRAGGHIPTSAAASSIISGTRYLRGWCHRSLSVFHPRIGRFHSRMTERMALCRANRRSVIPWTKPVPPLMSCQLQR